MIMKLMMIHDVKMALFVHFGGTIAALKRKKKLKAAFPETIAKAKPSTEMHHLTSVVHQVPNMTYLSLGNWQTVSIAQCSTTERIKCAPMKGITLD